MTDSVASLQQAANARQAYDRETDPQKLAELGRQWLAVVQGIADPMQGATAARIMAVDLTPRPSPTGNSGTVFLNPQLAQASADEWTRRVSSLPPAQSWLAAVAAVTVAPPGSPFRQLASNVVTRLSLRR